MKFYPERIWIIRNYPIIKKELLAIILGTTILFTSIASIPLNHHKDKGESTTLSFEDDQLISLARKFVVLLSQKKYSEATALYDQVMLKALPPDQLARIWTQLEKQYGASLKYWFDLKKYNPVRTASSLCCPLLILQGGRDYQVTKEDFQGWQVGLKNNPQVTFKLYPSLNHLFFHGKGPSSPLEYEKNDHVALEVIENITQWIKTNCLSTISQGNQIIKRSY